MYAHRAPQKEPAIFLPSRLKKPALATPASRDARAIEALASVTFGHPAAPGAQASFRA
jgi:hypothetical protein